MNENTERQCEVTDLLSNVLSTYFTSSRKFREENQSLSNMQFHRMFGFSLKVPSEWDIYPAVQSLCNEHKKETITVVYSTSKVYHRSYQELKDAVSYISWHEIHTAMQISSSVPSSMSKVKSLLLDTDLVVVVDPPPLSLSSVLDQIMAMCSGCLIIIG